MPDIAIRGVTGNRTRVAHLFSYLNGHYTATGCNALWDKNEMGDVVISACKKLLLPYTGTRSCGCAMRTDSIPAAVAA